MYPKKQYNQGVEYHERMAIMKKFLISFVIALILLFGAAHYTLANTPQVNNDFKTYMAHASKAFAAKDYNTAIINFKKAIQINPNNYGAYCILGMSYGYLGKAKEAEETLILATKKFPNEWVAYTFLGDIKRAQGLTPLAVDYYDKAIKLPSLSETKKTEIQKLKEACIEEQKVREANIKDPAGEWIKVEDPNWKRAYFKGNDKHWLMTYGCNGEDVVNYKWTKILTIGFYDKNTYNYTPDTVYSKLEQLSRQSAKQLGGELIIQKLSSNENEVLYMSKVTGHGQSTICRIFKGTKGVYITTFEHKKPTFTVEEKADAINILKSIKEIQ